MYAAYFGLKEMPFSIAPDPAYLYMSEAHREALSHLLFGIRGSGGFILLTGEVANPANPPSGCYFHPRCTYAQDICKNEDPAFEEVAPEHFVKCHRARELSLTGAVVAPR